MTYLWRLHIITGVTHSFVYAQFKGSCDGNWLLHCEYKCCRTS